MYRNAEALETIAVVLLGVVLLITLEPVSTTQLMFAGILAGLVMVMTVISIWQWRHHSH